MQDERVVTIKLTDTQAEKLASVLLTHMENAREVGRKINSEGVTKAIETECGECNEIFDRIMEQRLMGEAETIRVKNERRVSAE